VEDRIAGRFPIVVLMGVSGAGKTTIGTALAGLAGVDFADADDYHSSANRAKMAAGIALTDADRGPWLQTLNGLLDGWFRAGTGGVLACSALKETYRAALAAGMSAGAVQFVLLEGSRELIAARLAVRKHSYMNPALLDSQFATLEVPRGALMVVNDREPDVIASEILGRVAVG
jgi:gluconokinase